MQTLASALSLSSVHLTQNLLTIQDNVVAPIMMRHRRAMFLTKVALAGVLLAFGTGGFAQTQQVSAANIALDKLPDGETGNVAVVEKKPATAASQPQSAAGLSNEIANPLSNLWLLQMQQNNTLLQMPSGKGTYVQSNLQFQPLLPIHVTPHWNWISPIVDSWVLTKVVADFSCPVPRVRCRGAEPASLPTRSR